MSQTMRVTIHLTTADRELLEGIRARRAIAEAQAAQAERDFIVAGTGMATSRGLRAANVLELTDHGLVLELPVAGVPLDQENA